MQGAKEQGAKLLTGGGPPPQLQKKGFFVAPTVFTDVTPDMTIWREEVFGPVLATTTFSDEAEAVRIANKSEYGLGAAVISANKEVSRGSDLVCEETEIGVSCSRLALDGRANSRVPHPAESCEACQMEHPCAVSVFLLLVHVHPL